MLPERDYSARGEIARQVHLRGVDHGIGSGRLHLEPG